MPVPHMSLSVVCLSGAAARTEVEATAASPQVALMARAVDIYTTVLGIEHPDTAELMAQLALLYQERGYPMLAVPWIRKVALSPLPLLQLFSACILLCLRRPACCCCRAQAPPHCPPCLLLRGALCQAFVVFASIFGIESHLTIECHKQLVFVETAADTGLGDVPIGDLVARIEAIALREAGASGGDTDDEEDGDT